MSKKISELTETIEPINSDVMPIINSNETKKIKLSSLIEFIKSALNSVFASITHTHKTSELENDSGYITGYTETDPTVPAWAKESTKPTYTFNEIAEKPSTYTPPVASADTLGGVKVGAGLSISNGVLSATGGGTADSVDWNSVLNKPDTYTPTAHTHKSNEITDLPTIPTNTSQLNNDSNFVASTVVTAFWSGTQAEYDALTTKNATTLYLITE